MDPFHSAPPSSGADTPADPVPTLRARGVQDLLGYAGHVLGTLPPRGVLMLTLRGSGLRAVVRVDPPVRCRDGARWARAVAEVCRRDREADGALVLRLDVDGRAGGDVPDWRMPLEMALRDAGLPVREGWEITGRRARAWCGGPGAPEPDTVALGDPALGVLSLELMTRGSVWGLRAADTVVPPRPPAAERTEAAWAALAAGRRTRRPDAAWRQAWDAVLSGGSPPRTAVTGEGVDGAGWRALGAPLVLPPWRDDLLLRAATGPEGPRPSRVARSAVLTARSTEAPDWRRLDRLWEAMRALAAAAPSDVAAQALAVAAWVAWARGQGSAAAAHVEAAAALDPEDGFVRVLGRIVVTGDVAGWAADPRLAWRP